MPIQEDPDPKSGVTKQTTNRQLSRRKEMRRPAEPKNSHLFLFFSTRKPIYSIRITIQSP